MRRVRKIILLIPFLVILLIGLLVLRRLGPPPEHIRLVAQSELSRTLGRQVSIGRDVLGRMLAAAKDPVLAMKLQNMPVPLRAELVDEYMAGVLEAAWSGDLAAIVTR